MFDVFYLNLQCLCFIIFVSLGTWYLCLLYFGKKFF